jgi:hypothetical protein
MYPLQGILRFQTDEERKNPPPKKPQNISVTGSMKNIQGVVRLLYIIKWLI